MVSLIIFHCGSIINVSCLTLGKSLILDPWTNLRSITAAGPRGWSSAEELSSWKRKITEAECDWRAPTYCCSITGERPFICMHKHVVWCRRVSHCDTIETTAESRRSQKWLHAAETVTHSGHSSQCTVIWTRLCQSPCHAYSFLGILDFCLLVPQATYSWYPIRYQVLHRWGINYPIVTSQMANVCLIANNLENGARNVIFSVSGANRDRFVRNQWYVYIFF